MVVSNLNLTGIAKKLVLDKHLDEVAAMDAVKNSNSENIQLTSYLLKNKIVPSSVLAMISSQEFGLPVFDLSVMDIDQAAITLVEEKLISKEATDYLLPYPTRPILRHSMNSNLIRVYQLKPF
jgi:type IV pilus assembly protein PilB